MTLTERGQENKCLRSVASSVRTVWQSLSTLLPTPPSPTQLHESTLLSSILSAAITNHTNRFTFGGVIAKYVKTIFAP